MQRWRLNAPERSQELNARADANRSGTERRREQLAANHADRQAAVRERNESKPLTEAADCVLANVHECSGSGITANSRRLVSLERAHGVESDEYKGAKADTEADIKRFGNVTFEDKAKCVSAYVEARRALDDMKVCACCGLRDPEVTYHEKTFASTLPDWLAVDEAALARLDAAPAFQLLKRPVDGDSATETFRRRDLHNLLEVGGRTYHLIEEAVQKPVQMPDAGHAANFGKFDVCEHCQRCWYKQRPADAAAVDARDVGGGFDDLYSKHAPRDSIAAGQDYGRLAALCAKGIDVNVSALEKLVLAKARCHYVSVKVVANGKVTARERLIGHTIIFEQKPDVQGCGSFCEAVLRAALGQLKIYLVGPSGERGKLERAALKVDDVRLRPHVVYNFLKLREVVAGAEAPPSIESIEALINPPGAPSAV